MESNRNRNSNKNARRENRARSERPSVKRQKRLSPARRRWRILFAHALIIFSVLILTFFVVDRFNTAMGFMTSDISKWFIAVLALIGLINGLMSVTDLWQ